MGDIGFLHDISALASAQLVKTPLVCVVINNDGGRIFDQLPAAQIDSCGSNFNFWTTPHAFNLQKISEAYGIQHVRVMTLDALTQTLRSSYDETRLTIIEAIVPPDSFKKQAAGIWGTE